MSFIQSVDGCMQAAIADCGLSPAALEARLKKLEAALSSLKTQYESGSLPLLRVAEQQQALEDAKAALERLSEGAKTLVFFGTGGSSLGGQAIAQLGGWFIPGDQKRGQENRPRTRFYDNLDPHTLETTLAGLDLERTRFIVISKSGNTPETLVQCLAALQAVKEAGLETKIPNLFLGLTEPASDKPNGLRQICTAFGIEMLDHDPGIGGRFAALTNVGLLPALSRGLDAAAMLKGAGEVVGELLSGKDPLQLSPAVGAATGVALAQDKNARIHVLMPYCDRLERFADWYVQLAAESLGKQERGFTPVAALGPVDQHSQLQLYLDGPREHFITLLRTRCADTGPRIDKELAEKAGAGYLAGYKAGDLVDAQQHAIVQTLIDASRPVRTIDVERLDEQALGSLMMHFMLETILAAYLLEVDPYDQPAVEAGKILTRQKLEARNGG